MLSGTTVQSRILLRRGEMTTTGRFFTISGAMKPVLKSQIRSVPGFGWKVTMKANWTHSGGRISTSIER